MPTYIPYLFNIVRQLLEPLARIEEYYTMVQQQMGNNVSLDAKGDIFPVVAISHICIHLERTRGIRGDVMIPSL